MEIDFKWIGAATWILKVDHLKIACDPCLCAKGTVQNYFWFKANRLDDPIYDEDDFLGTDIWLLTHGHQDHIDLEGSKMITSGLVVTDTTAKKALDDFQIKPDPYLMEWGESFNYEKDHLRVNITCVPAIHGVIPLSAFFAGHVNGYYLTITDTNSYDTYRIYITGDTVYKPVVIRAIFGKKIDLMIANMGAAKKGSWMGTLTLSTRMLDRFIEEADPQLVIPVHYGSFSHFVEGIDDLRLMDTEKLSLCEMGSWCHIGVTS